MLTIIVFLTMSKSDHKNNLNQQKTRKELKRKGGEQSRGIYKEFSRSRQRV